MASLSPFRPRLQITGISYAWLSVSSPDSTAVAEAIDGTGWSVRYHEAPDYKASLMILPEDDDRFSTFVISASGACLCLHECRDDVLHALGEFGTLGDAITRLCHAMADQTAPRAGGVTGRAWH